MSKAIYADLKGDKIIWMILGVLAMFSVLAVYSSTGTLAYVHHQGNVEVYLIKQLMIVGAGLFITFVCYKMHYMSYSKFAPILLLASIILLTYTFFFGIEVNDARRWIGIPIAGGTFQPSDFAKLALIIYVARSISTKQGYINDFKSAFLPIILPILIVCGLIAPSDLSSAALIFLTCVMMMIIGRVSMKYIGLLLVFGMFVFALLILIGTFNPELVRVETWISRITEFFANSDGGYQIQQAKIAIANGELIGNGPGGSVQRNFLPAPYSDFIFAIICEEYGLIGGGFIIFIYLLLLVRCVKLVTVSPKAFGAMIAIGLGLSLVLQALANIAVSVHLLPVTGLTLPMVSMGGTSFIFSCMAFGIILSVSKYIEKVA